MTFLQNRGIVRYVSAADSQQERSVFYIGKKRGKAKMTFYQELQLSSVGSKQLIKNTTDKKEKTKPEKKDCMDVSPVMKQDAISMTFLSAVGKKWKNIFFC